MVTFYAFCRIVDDLADDNSLPLAARASALAEWKNGILYGFEKPGGFEQEVLAMRDAYTIPNELLLAIVEGCGMDLQPQRFATWDDLAAYIWKVAGAVGLVSTRIFGCENPASARYAEVLGNALQLTNILRDVGEDFANGGRIYLPHNECAEFGYLEADFSANCEDARFRALMNFQAQRAEAYFAEAEAILPPTDRSRLRAARMMAEIYRALLLKMCKDGFRVFSHRYQISKARKFAILARNFAAVIID